MEEFDIVGLLSLFVRNKKRVVLVFCVVLLACVFVTLSWSNYRSVATVEVALSEIAPSATSTPENESAPREALVDRQISYLQQKVFSTGSLVEIITKYDLYPSKRRQQPMASVADMMRKKIKLDLLGGVFANASAAQKVSAGQLSAIAFTLSFEYSNPLLAQQVANELVTRFLDEDIKQKRTQAKETTAFLDSQLKVLEESLSAQEKKLAEFRAAHGNTRPEALAFNQQAANSLLLSLQNVEAQITSNIGEQGALRGQLAATDPYSRIVSDGETLTTPSIQLRALKSEYATLTAKYGPAHPDVIKVSKQIEAMESEKGSSGRAASLRALIHDAQTRLTVMQKTLGEENPDLISLRTQIESYESQLKQEQKKTKRAELSRADADNPAYLQIVAALRASEEQGKALQSQKEALQESLEKYQDAVIENPVVEQQLAALTRDYDNAQIRYRELKANKLTAEMNEVIEQDRVGQRFVLINPPELPISTTPSRLLLVFASVVGAIFCSIASVFLQYVASPTILSARHLQSIVGAAPLVVLSHIERGADGLCCFPFGKPVVTGVIVLVVLVLLGLFSFMMPLDALVSVVGTKLGLV